MICEKCGQRHPVYNPNSSVRKDDLIQEESRRNKINELHDLDKKSDCSVCKLENKEM